MLVSVIMILLAILIAVLLFQNKISEFSQTPRGLAIAFIAGILTILFSIFTPLRPFITSLLKKLFPGPSLDLTALPVYRKDMIKALKNQIDDILAKSLNNVVTIELELSECRGKVDPPLNRVLRQPESPPEPLPPGSKIIETFDKVGGSFLILGDAGSGKTTILLQLAKDLLDRAESDEHFRIPVVFNLSSWSIHREPLEDWLVSELQRCYQIPRMLGQRWVDDDSILPLLDGLDEVVQQHREECVEAINEFKSTRGLLPVVICSRINEFEALRVKLELPTAILVEPLTPDQIREYFDKIGSPAERVKAALEKDETLRELLKTPLMLNVITLAVISLPEEPINLEGTLEEQRRKIFDYFKKAMFARPLRSEAFSSVSSESGQRWLRRKVLRHLRLIRSKSYTQAQTERWLSWLARSMKEQNQSTFYLEWLQDSWLPSPRQRKLIRLVFWLVVGLLFGVGSVQRFTKLVEKLDFKWDIRGLVIWLVYGLVGGLVYGLVVGLSKCLVVGNLEAKSFPNEGIHRSIHYALIICLPTSMLGIIFAKLLSNVPFMLSSWLSIRWGAENLSQLELIELNIIVWFAPVFIMILYFFGYGGGACIYHFILRIMLRYNNSAPLDYVNFLEYAVDRIFLKRVGGGYVFIHGLLMDYFATIEQDIKLQ